MGKTTLFSNWTWRRNLSEPFRRATKKRTDAYSVYNTTTEKESTLHAPTLCAIMAYMDIDGKTAEAKGAIGTRGNTIVAEYPSHRAGETHVCVFNKDTDKFTAGIFKDSSTSPEPYEMKSKGDGQSGSAMFFALMPIFLQVKEFADEYRILKSYKESGYADMESASRSAAILCDNIYRRIENAAGLTDAGIIVNVPASGNIQPFNALMLNKNEYSPTNVIAGNFEIFTPVSEPEKPKETAKNEDFAGKYALSERTFTEAEKQMIPTLANWYIIPPEVIAICRHAKMTTESTIKMRNFMLRGPSGTGKTEGAKAVAAGFGLPYVYITCSANTEITDLLGQILPDVQTGSDSQTEQSDICNALPTYEDIQMDPATAYCTLTGEYIENITAEEVYGRIIMILQNGLSSGSASLNSDKQGFRYIDTALVDAIRYGYICELQEPSIIANPGVLVGLNSLLDNCSTVTLPTGETIKRHPDTVILVTTNNDYQGCKKLNQSVISRMDLVFDVDEPDIETLAGRVMKITKCVDGTMVRRMAETVKEISKHCRQEMITDGCCGVRELIAWVQSYMISNNALESSRYTVLSAVSSDPENRDEIYKTCLQTQYAA